MKNLLNTNGYGDLSSLVEGWVARSVLDSTPLSRAMRYGLMGGGKRLRGVFLLAVAEALDCPQQLVCSSVCASEMVHAASLIHDDLPALDNDDIRRGKPTCHRVFGEGSALLAGDALIARAHEVLLTDAVLSTDSRVALALELAKAVQGLCEGQEMDLEQTGRHAADIDPAALELRHQLKTGALFSFCSVAPAVILQLDQGRSASQSLLSLDQLRFLGLQLGLLFQIADDILGASASTAQLGKRAGTDAVRGVETFVSLYGLNGARARGEEVLASLLQLLDALGSRAAFLSSLCHFALERER